MPWLKCLVLIYWVAERGWLSLTCESEFSVFTQYDSKAYATDLNHIGQYASLISESILLRRVCPLLRYFSILVGGSLPKNTLAVSMNTISGCGIAYSYIHFAVPRYRAIIMHIMCLVIAKTKSHEMIPVATRTEPSGTAAGTEPRARQPGREGADSAHVTRNNRP